MSRVSQNEDVLHLLLVSSDPFISSIRKIPKKQLAELDDDVKSLLKFEVNEIQENVEDVNN